MSSLTTEHLRARLEQIGNRVSKQIFCFADKTQATEWNTAHHFAVLLHAAFPEYDCDFDLSKKHEASGLYRRPDIVLHQRGSQDRNFLVVEMKMHPGATGIAADAQKIRDIWFEDFRYQFGATIILNAEQCVAKVMKNPRALRIL